MERTYEVTADRRVLQRDPGTVFTDDLPDRLHRTLTAGGFLTELDGAAAASADTDTELAGHTREELDAIAKDLGVEDPGAMSNKAAVIEAIHAVRTGGVNHEEGPNG